ncbi:hypothetical protein V6N13_078291 [Hibiscus sabdariffa]
MMADSFTKILLVAAVILSNSSFPSLADSVLWHHFCSNATSLTKGSIYATNINQLFSYLSTNATEHDGFFNTTAGQGPNMMYGLFLCRGDVRPESCRECVDHAAADIAHLCPNQTGGIVWYEMCMLRYSNLSIFSSMADRPRISLSYNENVTEPDRFNRLVATVMKDIASRASTATPGTKKFATKETAFKVFQTLYSLAQCTPDISSDDCYTCLQEAIADLQIRSSGLTSGFAMFPSCTAQYWTIPFYSLNQTESAPPPVSPQHPLLLPPPPPGKRGNSSLGVIKIVLPTVGSILVLSSFLCCFLGWKPTKKLMSRKARNDGIEDKAMQSLQFEYGAIEAATNNFSEVNKVGAGGFGSVYKLVEENESLQHTKRIVGTYGYMSPEYAMHGRFSDKSDVFSFGILILEICVSLTRDYVDFKSLCMSLTNIDFFHTAILFHNPLYEVAPYFPQKSHKLLLERVSLSILPVVSVTVHFTMNKLQNKTILVLW